MRIVFIVNDFQFFKSHRMPVALAAQEAGYEVHIVSGAVCEPSELDGTGLVLHPIKVNRRSQGVFSNTFLFIQIFFALWRLKPDVVHLVTIKPVILGGIAARILKVPAVVVAISGLGHVFTHNGFLNSFRRLGVSWVYRFALGHRKIKVICQNCSDLEQVQKMTGLPDRKMALIRGSGVDLSMYVHSPLPKGLGPPIVMMASRLLIDKGVSEFIAAAEILVASGQDVRFVLVGKPDPGNPTSVSQELLDDWICKEVVEFWGHRDDMTSILPLAQIIVLPSYREGLPKVLLEAAAIGRPVITTDVPGCRDAIEPGVTGLLVARADADGLARAIKTLISEPELCAALGAAGRSLAENAFDLKKVVVSHIDIYREMTERLSDKSRIGKQP